MIKLIVILYTGSSISIYLYRHLVVRKYRIIKKRTLKQSKELFLSLIGIWLSNIKNFIPNTVSKFDYKKLVWMKKKITLFLRKRWKLTKKYCNDPSDHNKNLLVNTANESTRLIIAAKEKNLIRLIAKLEDPNTALKTYWSISNRFFSNKKIPNIPPILVNGKVVSNFAKKAKLFNSYFASQCTPVITKSQLPFLEFKTRKRLENNFYWWRYKPNNKECKRW